MAVAGQDAAEAAVIQKILEHPRADTIHLISHPDKGGRTVAHYAAIREEDGDDVLFKLLKKHGANFEAIDHGGNKPATLAAKAGRKKSKELLEEALVK
jgi:ankyrin repeat protein